MIDTMKNPNQRLLALIKRYKLTSAEIIEILECSRTSVYCWMRYPGTANFSAISPAMLRLLELEIGAAKPTHLR
jgi:hypothetical protein